MPHQSLAERVPHAIRAAMRTAGATQTALAAELGISQQALSRRLTGEVPLSIVELDIIAAALHTTTDQLTEADPS